MLTETFTYNGAVVTVHRASVRSRLREQFIYQKFDLGKMDLVDFAALQAFVVFMTSTEVKGDLGFSISPLTAESKEMHTTFDRFLDLPGTFYDEFQAAVNKVNVAPGDPETTPETLEKKE